MSPVYKIVTIRLGLQNNKHYGILLVVFFSLLCGLSWRLDILFRRSRYINRWCLISASICSVSVPKTMYQGSQRNRDVNPKEKAGIFSILNFLYAFPILRKGLKKELIEDDVYEILTDFKSCKLGDELEAEWERESVKKKQSFTSVLWRRYGSTIILWGSFKFIVKTLIMIVKPLATGRLVSYFSPGSELTKNDAFFYAGTLGSMLLLNAFFTHQYMLMLLQVAHKARIAVCSLIYRKSLKLTTSSLAEVTNGKIVTLMTKDVLLFEHMMQFGNDVWIGIIQLFIMSYIMYRQIQISSIAGVGFLLLVSPIQMILAKITMKVKLKTLAKSDERIRLLQEILSTIQIIKIYTWEKYFKKLVDSIRKSEIGKIKIMYYLKMIGLTLGGMSTKISFYICMITYIYLHDSITAEKAFIIQSCYTTVQHIITVTVPIGISQIAEVKSSIKRIKSVLVAKEIDPAKKTITDKPEVIAKDITAEILREKPILKNINLNLKSGIHAITGEVGCGKSTLLKLVLGDLSITDGELEVNGAVSYASQDPWLFPGTIMQNILFGQKYEEKRYKEILSVCGLVKDLERMKRGDKTLVSDRGLNLSKGQQARVNLARAIYKESDIYLLDSPLSALDANVSKQVFQSCFKSFLRNKLVIVVMHQMQYLKEVDTIFVMDDGEIKNHGSFEELERKGINFGTDFVEDSSKDENFDDFGSQSEEPEADSSETTKLLAQSAISLGEDAAKLYSENKREGKVLWSVYKKMFIYAGGFKTIPFFILICIAGQVFSSGFEFFLSYWINIEENLTVMKNNGTTNTTEYFILEKKKSMVPILYSGILLIATCLNFIGAIFMFVMAGAANKRLHNKSFWKVITAPMSFFDQNLSGNILNRFSKDITVIDDVIPFLYYQIIRIGFVFVGVIALMTIVKREFLFVSIAFSLALYGCRCLYLPTSRSLKRLDGTTRAPVIGHLNASLEGLITIRASGAQDILTTQFDKHQDLHSSSAYMYMSTNRAFGYYLDMLCVCYSVIIMLSLIIFAGANAGKVGLAVTLSFGLSQLLQYGIRQWAELENQMTSVERILEYTEVKGEDASGEKPEDWPKQGRIAYKNVRLVYPKTNELILKGITFDVQPGQKIGIIGRTGAGKTSIISTLFRLYGIEEGSINVDNKEVQNIALHYARSKISIIPQNPVIFSGTLRSNLDPYDEYPDSDIWKALGDVKLKGVELDDKINDGGSNFSAGQKQLICLARAILRNNKVIVLDEATANIDPQTDVLIQETIKRIFADCTILMIAHRLNTVLTTDKVMVVDSGMIAEFDDPSELLKNPDSRFYQLVSQAGLLKP